MGQGAAPGTLTRQLGLPDPGLGDVLRPRLQQVVLEGPGREDLERPGGVCVCV